MHIAEVGGWSNEFSVKWCRGSRKADVVRFLRAADLAIDDVRVVLDESSEDEIADVEPQIRLTHATKSGGHVELNLYEESHGTQKMFAFAAPWSDSLENGNVMVCDELHDNLHPALVRFLVDRFHDCEGSRTEPLYFGDITSRYRLSTANINESRASPT